MFDEFRHDVLYDQRNRASAGAYQGVGYGDKVGHVRQSDNAKRDKEKKEDKKGSKRRY